MEIFDITQYRKGMPAKSVRNEIGNNSGRIFIEYPMSHINSSNSYLDIIHNYIEASYIAEELGKCATSIKADLIPKDPYSPICRFEILVRDTEALVKRAGQLSIALYEDQEDDDILQEYSDELHAYTESLDDRVFLCPDLMDGYYANLVGLAYEEMESEYEEGFLKREYKKYPERAYGFWKSAYSRTIGEVFYVSRECWVIPLGIDVQKLLLEYSGFSSAETYDEAILFALENVNYLASQRGVVYFPINPLLHAKNFVTATLRKSDTDGILNNSFLTYFSSIENDFQERHGIRLYATIPQAKYLLSHSNLSVIVDDGNFRYIFFPQQIKSNKIPVLYEQISVLFGYLGEFAGVTKTIELSWADFDDEKFENLCYDIIYHHAKFDNNHSKNG
jgi:hypothetical protein